MLALRRGLGTWGKGCEGDFSLFTLVPFIFYPMCMEYQLKIRIKIKLAVKRLQEGNQKDLKGVDVLCYLDGKKQNPRIWSRFLQ